MSAAEVARNSTNDERRNPRRTRERSMFRKSILAAAIGVTIVGAHARAETPGVTSTEVKVGATFPFSGPASPLSNTGKGLIAYINSINERGGINGRKINLITYDDAYSPPKTVEQTRKLVESDEWPPVRPPPVPPGIGATINTSSEESAPSVFCTRHQFTNFAEFPMTTTGLPSYDTKGGSTRNTSLRPGRTQRCILIRTDGVRLRQCIQRLPERRLRQESCWSSMKGPSRRSFPVGTLKSSCAPEAFWLPPPNSRAVHQKGRESAGSRCS